MEIIEIIVFVFFFIVSALSLALMFYLANRIDFLEDKISEQADRLSQELFTDYDCITEQFGACLSKIDSAQKSISLEIACLATKNNEDIKRMGGGYVVGDVLKFDGIEWYVFCKTKLDDGRTRWDLFGQNGDEYRIYSIYTNAMPADIEFVRHVDVESLFS